MVAVVKEQIYSCSLTATILQSTTTSSSVPGEPSCPSSSPISLFVPGHRIPFIPPPPTYGWACPLSSPLPGSLPECLVGASAGADLPGSCIPSRGLSATRFGPLALPAVNSGLLEYKERSQLLRLWGCNVL